jgi:hypothetical protein
MKRAALFFALTLAAAVASAQPSPSFSIGPRISSYSTDLDVDLSRVETGRQTSFGLVGDYRNGAVVFDWLYNHDASEGASIFDVVANVSDYERNWGEATVGYAIAPIIDLQGGVRIDSIRLGGARLFGGSIFSDLDLDHQAVTAGVRLHTPNRGQVGWYGTARGYIGTAKFDRLGERVNSDTTGWRAETGVMIRIGESNWYIVPGAEYERLETKDFGLDLKSNRLFLNFVFTR